MKLLTPSAQKDETQVELSRDVIRVQEVKKVVEDWNKKLAKAEADFSLMLAGQRDRYALEELEHEKRVKEMKQEVDTLEAKKYAALVPINILKEGGVNRLEEAEKFMASLRKREDDAEELTERLEEKLDEVGERELVVKNEQRRLRLLQEGVERQQDFIKSQNEQLTKSLSEFVMMKEQAEKDIDARKSALFLMDTSLAKEREFITSEKRRITEEDRRLADERDTLERAWREVRRISPPKEAE